MKEVSNEQLINEIKKRWEQNKLAVGILNDGHDLRLDGIYTNDEGSLFLSFVIDGGAID